MVQTCKISISIPPITDWVNPNEIYNLTISALLWYNKPRQFQVILQKNIQNEKWHIFW